jgi:hypothetical protein
MGEIVDELVALLQRLSLQRRAKHASCGGRGDRRVVADGLMQGG